MKLLQSGPYYFHEGDIVGPQDRPFNESLGKDVQVSSELTFKVVSPFNHFSGKLAFIIIAAVDDVHLLIITPVIQVLRAVPLITNLVSQALLRFQLVTATCLCMIWDPGGHLRQADALYCCNVKLLDLKVFALVRSQES